MCSGFPHVISRIAVVVECRPQSREIKSKSKSKSKAGPAVGQSGGEVGRVAPSQGAHTPVERAHTHPEPMNAAVEQPEPPRPKFVLALIQFVALTRKNAIVLRRSPKSAAALLLVPVLVAVGLGAWDLSQFAAPGVEQNAQPFVTLDSSSSFDCKVFDDAEGGGEGSPMPGAWCAPMIFAPTDNMAASRVMKTVGERRGWTVDFSAPPDGTDRPAACAPRACLLGFVDEAAMRLWLATNPGRARAAIAFRGHSNGTTIPLRAGSELPTSVAAGSNQSSHTCFAVLTLASHSLARAVLLPPSSSCSSSRHSRCRST